MLGCKVLRLYFKMSENGIRYLQLNVSFGTINGH